MRPPNTNPAPLAGGNGADEDDQGSNRIKRDDKPRACVGQLVGHYGHPRRGAISASGGQPFSEPSASMVLDARALTKMLGGRWCGTYGLTHCPAHSDHNPSLSICDGKQEPIVNCFAGCHWKDVKTALARRGLLRRFPPVRNSTGKITRTRRVPNPGTDQVRRVQSAVKIWAESIPLPGTLGEHYFKHLRNLDMEVLGDCAHAIRWHERISAVVGLMTDPITGKPCGVHRTFLNRDGRKLTRKMLGIQGVIHLSADAEVSFGLGIVEGIEDGLAVLLCGWHPVWVATSAGAISRLPVLSGVDALTIFADGDSAGMKAAAACASRWRYAGREANVLLPFRGGTS
jgi:putative DNA primase/helicase